MFSWMLQAARTTPVAESKSITPESLAMFKRPCFWWYSSLQVAGRISSTSKIKKIGTRHGSQRWSIPVNRAPNFRRKSKGIEPSNQDRGGELSTPNNHKTMINNHSPRYPPVMGHTILQIQCQKPPCSNDYGHKCGFLILDQSHIGDHYWCTIYVYPSYRWLYIPLFIDCKTWFYQHRRNPICVHFLIQIAAKFCHSL